MSPSPAALSLSTGRVSRVRPVFALRLGAAVFAVLAFAVSWWRWYSFQYTTFDLAFYVQGLWLALHGQFHVPLLGVPILGNHAEPIVFLLLPLFALVPHPMLLVAVQIAALASLPFTAARILQRLHGEALSWPACALALATLLAPAAGYVAIHEFHPEAFAAPLLLLVYEARLARRPRLFWCWFLLALGCKENIALVLVGFCGVHAWLERRSGWRTLWQWAVGPMLTAAAWVAAYAFLLAPWLNAGRVDYGNLYAPLGHEAGEIVLNLGRAFWNGATGGNLLWGMLLTFAAAPLLRPRWLLIAAPILAQHLLSTRASEWTIYFHYAAPLLSLFWLAAAEAFPVSRAWWPVAAALLLQPFIGPVRELVGDARAFEHELWERSWKAPLLQQAQQQPQWDVAAGLPFLSHLATRPQLHSIHFVLKGLQTLSRQRYVPAYRPDAVLLDCADKATFNQAGGYYHPAGVIDGRPLPSSDELLNEFLARQSWQTQTVNSLTLWTACEAAAPVATPADGLLLYPHTKLTETRLTLLPNGEADLELGWRYPSPRTNLPWVSLELRGAKQRYLLELGLCAAEAGPPAGRQKIRIKLPPSLPADSYEATAVFRDEIRALWGRGGDPTLARVSLGKWPWATTPQ